MLIKSCSNCKFHEIKQEGKEKISYCARENCYSQYSKCLTNKALSRFLEQESGENARTFSAVTHFYPQE
jgi:hypothetical protein